MDQKGQIVTVKCPKGYITGGPSCSNKRHIVLYDCPICERGHLHLKCLVCGCEHNYWKDGKNND
jgi:hypothetical protein